MHRSSQIFLYLNRKMFLNTVTVIDSGNRELPHLAIGQFRLVTIYPC